MIQSDTTATLIRRKMSGRLKAVSLTNRQWPIPAQASQCSPLLFPCGCFCESFCWEEVKGKWTLCGKRLRQQMRNRLCQQMHRWNRKSRRWFNHLNAYGSTPQRLCDSSPAKAELVCYHSASNDRWWQFFSPRLPPRNSLRLFPMEHSYCSQKTDNGIIDARGSNLSGHHL